MAYTQTDLDNVRTALLDFSQGKRVGSVTIGNKTIKYAETTLEALEKYETKIAEEIAAAARAASASVRRRFFMTSSSKGL